jgi:hypothetical protein
LKSGNDGSNEVWSATDMLVLGIVVTKIRVGTKGLFIRNGDDCVLTNRLGFDVCANTFQKIPKAGAGNVNMTRKRQFNLDK